MLPNVHKYIRKSCTGFGREKRSIKMKKKIPIVAVFALSMFAACALAGCGASLDREVSVQSMAFKAPNSWIESSSDGNGESRGMVSFVEDNADLDEDETGNSLVVSYEKLAEKPEAASAPAVEESGAEQEAGAADPVVRTAAEAIAAKQADLEKKHGISAWSIDKEKSQVIDGAQVTIYEYSFVKDIEGVKRTYEFKTAYVVAPDTIYEINVVGDKVDINSVVDSIEL